MKQHFPPLPKQRELVHNIAVGEFLIRDQVGLSWLFELGLVCRLFWGSGAFCITFIFQLA